jgi:hypothetical protein
LQKVLPRLNTEVVTGSAFTQARYKIKPAFFKELVSKTVQCHNDVIKNHWKGHRIVAGDGSTVNLPVTKDVIKNFQVYSQTELGLKTCLGRVFFLYDILNDFIIHGELSPMNIGEKPLLIKSISSVEDLNDVYILDRGFGHFNTVAEFFNRKKSFCIRLSQTTTFAKRLLKKRGIDFLETWEPTKKEIENTRKKNIPSSSIQIRIVKVRLKSGEIELLATNLMDQIKYTAHEISQLYKLRWGVEEGFKKFKPKMKIEQFGCRKSEGLFQEFYAHIFCFNMISLSGAIANIFIDKKTAHCKRKYKYNWQNAYRFFREKIILFTSSVNKAESLFEELIKQIISSIIAVRPGRIFIRDLRHKNKQRRITQLLK